MSPGDGRQAYETAPEVWRLIRPEALDACLFDDGLVVHDDLGASVLLLSPVAGDLFLQLKRQPTGRTLDDLAWDVLGGGVDGDDLAAVEQLLEGLRAQGLVERLTP